LLKPNFIRWQPVLPTAGFVGTLDHLPNLLGIQYLAKELQRSGFNYKLELIGGPASTGERLANQYNFICYVGPVSDAQLVEQVKTWSVFLNPVFWYARGASTKLAQAVNWGLPCLTTPAGRRGYHLNNEAIVTADNTPKTFAKAVINALADNAQLSVLKRASENNAEQFDMKPYIDQLKDFLNRIAATE
jgi:glycosyltransferase involved in cell wall biosynthesis